MRHHTRQGAKVIDVYFFLNNLKITQDTVLHLQSLVDTFLQSDLQCIQSLRFPGMCVLYDLNP